MDRSFGRHEVEYRTGINVPEMNEQQGGVHHRKGVALNRGWKNIKSNEHDMMINKASVAKPPRAPEMITESLNPLKNKLYRGKKIKTREQMQL